jgi:7-carboxy-7-deazaguanine synthase
MVLVRLQGCKVGCTFCDTKETWHTDPSQEVANLRVLESGGPINRFAFVEEKEIAARCREIGGNISWALLTGGEPAEQPLAMLVEELHSVGFQVAIETSGTALGHVDAGIDWICISPKFNQPGNRPFLMESLANCSELKLVIGKEEHVKEAEAFVGRVRMFIRPWTEISLQPISQSQKATNLCVEACMRNNWRLSIQSHKTIGLA